MRVEKEEVKRGPEGGREEESKEESGMSREGGREAKGKME